MYNYKGSKYTLKKVPYQFEKYLKTGSGKAFTKKHLIF